MDNWVNEIIYFDNKKNMFVVYVMMSFFVLLSLIIIIMDIKVLKYALMVLGVLFINLIIFLFFWVYLSNMVFDNSAKEYINGISSYNKVLNEINREVMLCKNWKTEYNYSSIICNHRDKSVYIPEWIHNRMMILYNDISHFNLNNENKSLLEDKFEKMLLFMIVDKDKVEYVKSFDDIIEELWYDTENK